MDDNTFITNELIESQKKYHRLVNYISAAQLYLKDNFLLSEPLEKEHIKKRILGHWGTVPGLNFIYMNLNLLIKRHGAEIMTIFGPGHGYPGLLSNLFLEGTLGDFYPEYKIGKESVGKLIKNFSWPGGFPSHANPETPGVIVEGGELGYSLATAYGAALDNPDLIVAVVVGDGEAETGTIAGSWHSNKFLNPKTSGAVLPIVHINKYKISGPTIYGTMSDEELTNLFKGYGYEPILIQEENIYEDTLKVFESAFQKIKQIQKKFREEGSTDKPVWPVILMKSKKGWTGVKTLKGKMVEDSFFSHGIPLANPATDEEEFKALEEWLRSYKIEELVDENFNPIAEIKNLIPEGELRMGQSKHANNLVSKPLSLPEIKNYEVPADLHGTSTASSLVEASKYLRDVVKNNPDNFRIMSPDESESNKLHSIFEVTKRGYMWPTLPGAEDIAPDGRMMEILSENILQGWLQGYVLTGRHGILISYEAFMMIIASMVDQYSKFLKQTKNVSWRKPLPAMNFILTSTSWRQDHNGYSHQNPGFISSVLNDHSDNVHVYFPPDANTFTLTLEKALASQNTINVIVAGKTLSPQYLDLEKATKQTELGIDWWKGIGYMDGEPDVVFAASGDYATQESIGAIRILKKLLPEMKTRFVSVSELSALKGGNSNEFFTESKPVIYSYHGYPEDIKSLIFDHAFAQRFSIHGYIEKGTTTTPFDMQVVNEASRFHLVRDAVGKVAATNPAVKAKQIEVENYIETLLVKHAKHIAENGEDIDEIQNFNNYF